MFFVRSGFFCRETKENLGMFGFGWGCHGGLVIKKLAARVRLCKEFLKAPGSMDGA